MTEVNGLRLAFRGFVAGIAGGYVWSAIAMTLAALLHGDPLRPLRPIAMSITPTGGSTELSFVLGLAAVQAGGAVVGMLVSYFFARFFTVRPTLLAAAPVLALMTWGLVALVIQRESPGADFGAHVVPLLATIGYGLLLGAWVPVRGEVLRYPGSPST